MYLKNTIVQSTIIAKEFNTPLLIIDRRHKISNAIEDMNNATRQSDLIDIYRTLYPTTAEYRFLRAHKTCTKIDYMYGPLKSLNKFKGIQVIQNVFSD